MADERFDEDALQRALRAPGTPAELADEAAFRTMFRDAQAAGPALATVGGARVVRRTTARRLGATTALAAAFAVATAGVAAAYSTNLPAPVQRVVHSVLAPIGVPAADPEPPVDRVEPEPPPEQVTADPDPAPPVPGPSTPSEPASQSPSPEPTPSGTPSELPSVDPTGSASPTDPASPTESPTSVPSSATPTPTPTPSESPSPSAPSPSASPSAPEPTTPPAPTPAEVAIVSAGAGNRVAPGGTAVVNGRVGASDGAAVPDRQVVLQQRTDSGWQRIGVGRTSSNGSVSLATPPAQRTMTVRLRAGKVKSAPLRLVVQSSVTASAQTVDQTSTVTASVTGGQPGDLVLLLTRRDGQLVQEGSGTLDSAGRVQFTLAAPSQQRTYVVRLPATASHAAAQAKVLVAAADPTPVLEQP